MKFVIKEGDDEKTVYLDGKKIVVLNHDEDGYLGMRRVCDVIDAIAKKLGAEVEHK